MQKQRTYQNYLNRFGWLCVTPAIILFCLFMLYPILSSLYYVTQKWRGATSTFIGLGNFVRMLQDKVFLQALGNNFIFMVVQIPIMVFLALFLAVLLNQGVQKLRGPLRLAIFLPSVTSLVVVSVLFRMLLQTNGMLNNLLIGAHVIKEPIGWLSDPFWAKVTIILAMTWRWTGYNMVFFLVGLQSIDPQIYEAAEVDGASRFRQLFQITIPLLLPVILFSLVTSTSGTMQLFDEPNILTQGGQPYNSTMTAAVYIYRQAFLVNGNFGYATALSYVVVLISGVFAFIQMRLLGQRGPDK
ncbi:MAG TPA: sugar ABC transporter permease [Spirochaetales bacterium]|nr:sugar ABC transporter permease [Spirochaetales bacterium]HPS15456.1 sugar ABC transporter permease [Spirochaetales bacterium]